MSPSLDLTQIERALQTAAKAFAASRAAADAKALSRAELAASLIRYGAPAGDIETAVLADDPDGLPASIVEQVTLGLRRETGRQARYARANDPRYDINRHITARRLLRWLGHETNEATAIGDGGLGRSDRKPERVRTYRRTRHPDPLRPSRSATSGKGVTAANAKPPPHFTARRNTLLAGLP